MRLFFGLFLILIAGLALLGLPFQWLGLPESSPASAYSLWYGSVSAFAVPLCLSLLLLTRRNLIRLLCLVWGLWIAVLTVNLLFQSQQLLPSATPYGLFLTAFTGIGGLTTFLVALQILGKGWITPPK